jgi:hypothetical protein
MMERVAKEKAEGRDACDGIKTGKGSLSCYRSHVDSPFFWTEWTRWMSLIICKCLAYLCMHVKMKIMHQVHLAAPALMLVNCFNEVAHSYLAPC